MPPIDELCSLYRAFSFFVRNVQTVSDRVEVPQELPFQEHLQGLVRVNLLPVLFLAFLFDSVAEVEQGSQAGQEEMRLGP